MSAYTFKTAATAVLAVVTIALFAQTRRLSGLVAQKDADLSLQASRLEALELDRVENDGRRIRVDRNELERLRKEQTELLRLRGEVGLLRQAKEQLAKKLEAAANHTNQSTASTPEQTIDLPVGTVPRAQWADVGAAEPSTSLQSVMWAIREGRLDRLRDMATVSPDSDFDTVARDFQRVFTASAGFKQRKRTDFLAPDKAAMPVEVFMDDGRIEKGLMHFQKVGGVWLLKLD
jgi:hypothetical protein